MSNKEFDLDFVSSEAERAFGENGEGKEGKLHKCNQCDFASSRADS